jgi:peptidoglycan/LPS O-acetylase OafA/YrhL
MRQIKKVLISFLFLFLVFGMASAGTGDNVSGWSWSENIGWISFNCYNFQFFGRMTFEILIVDN